MIFHDTSMIYMVFTWYFLCYLYFAHAEFIIWRKTRQIWWKIWKNPVQQNPWNPLVASLGRCLGDLGYPSSLVCSLLFRIYGVLAGWKYRYFGDNHGLHVDRIMVGRELKYSTNTWQGGGGIDGSILFSQSNGILLQLYWLCM